MRAGVCMTPPCKVGGALVSRAVIYQYYVMCPCPFGCLHLNLLLLLPAWQEVARACAAGGTVPLTRAGPSELAAAPVGRAAVARVIGLGGRRALLLEFDEAACASGQVRAREVRVLVPLWL